MLTTEVVRPGGPVAESEVGVDFEITTSWYVPESGGVGCLLLCYSGIWHIPEHQGLRVVTFHG